MKQKEIYWKTIRQLREIFSQYYKLTPIKEVTEDIELPEEMREYPAALMSNDIDPQEQFTKDFIDYICEGDADKQKHQFFNLFILAGKQIMAHKIVELRKELEKTQEREQYWWKKNDDLYARIKELEQYAPEHLRTKVNPDARTKATKLVREMIDELEQML